MLKTVSSITNAIGALNYKGTWNASTNSPALASGTGTKGDYYVVSVAGSTALDGISNWGVGDWATYNGSVWQRVEGGANLNGVDLSVSGTSTLSGLTASTALALDASKNIVSVTNTGTGNNVLATAPTLVGNVSLSTGNLVMGTAGKGIDFSINPAAPGVTSELLADYEEGTFSPTLIGTTTNPTVTYGLQRGVYTKVGRLVTVVVYMSWSAFSGGSGNVGFGNLPFTIESTVGAGSSGAIGYFDGFTLTAARTSVGIFASSNTTYGVPTCFGSAVSTQYIPVGSVAASGVLAYQMTYFT